MATDRNLNVEDLDLDGLRGVCGQLKSDSARLQDKIDSAKREQQIAAVIRHADEDTPDDLTRREAREIWDFACDLIKKRRVDDVWDAYRMTGTSIQVVDKETVRLEITTAYDGQYFESFYVELVFGRKRIRVGRHTIPYFVPFHTIIDQYLNSSIKLFVSTLSTYLNAYVNRRQQAYVTQQAFVDVLLGPIQTSFAIDYVYFVIKPSVESPQPATVRLVYSDLKATLPDKVSVVREGLSDDEMERKAARKWCKQRRDLLKRDALPVAMKEVTLFIHSFNSSSVLK
ncbi:centromere protein O-like isoform X2 [Oscarella lobularis]|uniref:centromere protein O-like isoform X2 n=1 Tax=Oscarella lobularis TaxID=121494 RepID=UPI0033134230